jgi:hypothetical protein
MILAEMELAYTVLLGSAMIFGGAAVLALAWAFRNGQMSNFARGATSIFDPDEPVGEVTDQTLAPRTDDKGQRNHADQSSES